MPTPAPSSPPLSPGFDFEDSNAWATGLTLECPTTIIETFDAIRAGSASRLISALGEIPGPPSSVQMLGNLWVDELCDEAAVLLRQGIDVLRPMVLDQSEDDYRNDVVGLVQLIGEQPFRDLPASRGAQLLGWTNALLHTRATDLAQVGVDACQGAETPEALLAVVQALESRVLHRALQEGPDRPDGPPVAVPRSSSRSRL